MLSNTSLSKEFWVEAINTAYHLVNCFPHLALYGRILEQVWFFNLVKHSHLKIFSCLGYAHIDMGKLDACSVKCIFVRYVIRVKGYRLYNLKTKKIVVSRDVVFDESTVLQSDVQQLNVHSYPDSIQEKVEVLILTAPLPNNPSSISGQTDN